MNDIRLFSYKMTHDTGFAPNPFGGFLTLATCKPLIRKCKKIGDWIAGFTSIQLNADKVGSERLVYLMQVTDKIPFKEYWNNSKYEKKKPKPKSDIGIEKIGDNIYEPIVENPEKPIDYKLLYNLSHEEKDKDRDLSGEYILTSDNFYYFGLKSIIIPKDIRPTVPKGQSGHGSRTHDASKVNDFLSYIETKYQVGIYSRPHSWFSNDESWKNDKNYIKS